MIRIVALISALSTPLILNQASAQTQGAANKLDGKTAIIRVLVDECIDTTGHGNSYSCRNTHVLKIRYRFTKEKIFVDTLDIRTDDGLLSPSPINRKNSVIENAGDVYVIGKTIDTTTPGFTSYGKLVPGRNVSRDILSARVTGDRIILNEDIVYTKISSQLGSEYVTDVNTKEHTELTVQSKSCFVNAFSSENFQNAKVNGSGFGIGLLVPHMQVEIKLNLRNGDCHLE
jgi:hypothetical protein